MWSFEIVIPEKRRDKRLETKLEAEWPGILAKMIDGCRAWQDEGLNPPQCVIKRTAEYMKDEDAMGDSFGSCVIVDQSKCTRITELFDSWKNWATNAGEFVGKRKEMKAYLII